MNLGALNVYEAPDAAYGVNWNQMSDRKVAHVQVSNASGSNPGGNSTKRTTTRLRPGALSPGGVGVDIKHNSYARYLARLKGKGPVKQGTPPPEFGAREIAFDPAYPVYGGKLFKTGIVAGCVCDPTETNTKLYDNSLESNLNFVLFVPQLFNNGSDVVCVCPPTTPSPKNQYYGYTSSDSFLLQCAQKVECGDVIPIL